MKSVFKLLFFLVVLLGCSSDEGVDCVTGPVIFNFEVVDKGTGENLFGEGLYEPSQIHIEDKEENTLEFDFEAERNVVYILLGWESKSDMYTVTLGEEIEFNIVFTLEDFSSGSCTSTRLTELDIEGATYETSETTGLTTIFVSNEVE